jgi:hypothetical protein
MNNNKKILEDMLNASGGKIDRDTLEKATKTGDASALVGNLSQNDKEKLNQILSDKEELAKILNSPQAQMLLKMFKGDRNG